MARSHLVVLSSADRYLGYSHLLAVVNSVSVNIHIQRSVCVPVFSSSRYIPRGGTADSYGFYTWTWCQ